MLFLEEYYFLFRNSGFYFFFIINLWVEFYLLVYLLKDELFYLENIIIIFLLEDVRDNIL